LVIYHEAPKQDNDHIYRQRKLVTFVPDCPLTAIAIRERRLGRTRCYERTSRRRPESSFKMFS
jgi:hypothetical protein